MLAGTESLHLRHDQAPVPGRRTGRGVPRTMKLSTILATLADARLPSLTREQLAPLVGTAEGRAFGEDLRWYAAGETARRDHLAAVVHALAPAVRRSVEQMGLRFDLPAVIAAARRDGDGLFDTIRKGSADAAGRAHAVGYLRGIGLETAPVAPLAVPPYYSFKIFGGSAALCVTEARTRAGNQCTVQIEGALLLAGGGRREYDWRNKIVIQLAVQEAYLVLALFENRIPAVRFDGHGRAHDKSLHIEFQESHYFVRVLQRSRAPVAVPVRAVDAIALVSLLYRQLLANEPHLRIDDIRDMVGRMASMVSASRQEGDTGPGFGSAVR